MRARKVKKVVSSKNELTGKRTRADNLKEYHQHLNGLTEQMTASALKLDKNLLTVKIALMGAVRKVEKMMRERRE